MYRPTIKDIAKDCGVSIATVSYVINGKHDKVSGDTIRLVDESITRLGYIPNINAQSLVGKGSKLIGVIIPQIEVSEKMIFENPFYSEFISGVEYYLRKHGYSIVLSVINEQNGYNDMMKKWNIDGAILLGINENLDDKSILSTTIPTLLIDSYIQNDKLYRMNINDEESSYLATEFLIKEGHRKIALVTGEIHGQGVLYKRLLGYKNALKQNGIKYDENLVIQGDVSYTHGIESAGKIIKNEELTGIIATADIIAVGLINGFSINNKNVPDDYSVIGFDDTYLSSIVHPNITTIQQDISNRGELAGKIILNIINGNQKIKEVITKTKIIARQTTKEIS